MKMTITFTIPDEKATEVADVVARAYGWHGGLGVAKLAHIDKSIKDQVIARYKQQLLIDAETVAKEDIQNQSIENDLV